MNSSFQECYYQPNPPVTSTQGKYPTNAKDLNKSKSGGKKQPSKSGSGGGVRLSTDPQSVAARERRHRISHRLKTLQSLVPGAAKLDTVSLLDQAIHYVHFLHSQIQFHQLLLLSDVNSNVINDPPLLLPPPNPCFSSSSCDGDHYFAAVHLSPAAATLPPPSSDAGEGCFFVDLQGVGSSSTLNF